jgi:hypothetical protein
MIFNQNHLPGGRSGLTDRDARRNRHDGDAEQPVKRPAFEPKTALNWLIVTIAAAAIAPYLVLDVVLFVIDGLGATETDWHSTFVGLATSDATGWNMVAHLWSSMSMVAWVVVVWVRLTRFEPAASWLRYLRAGVRQWVRVRRRRCADRLMSTLIVRRSAVLLRRRARVSARRVVAWGRSHPGTIKVMNLVAFTLLLALCGVAFYHAASDSQRRTAQMGRVPGLPDLAPVTLGPQAAIELSDGSIVFGNVVVKNEGNGRYVLQFDASPASAGAGERTVGNAGDAPTARSASPAQTPAPTQSAPPGRADRAGRARALAPGAM